MKWSDVVLDLGLGVLVLAGLWVGHLIARPRPAPKAVKIGLDPELRDALAELARLRRDVDAGYGGVVEQRNELREALDDMWGCIDKPGIDDLQPETVLLAKRNHELLNHGGD